MSNERFYTVTPYDFDAEAFTQEGLQSALDKARELWGGKEHKAAAVSPALSLGSGATIIATEQGRATFVRDDAAKAMARARAAAEQEPDGRTRTFYAEATIVRVLGVGRAEEVVRKQIEGVGLLGLCFELAMFTQESLGDVPDCMSLQTCEGREASMRSQMSRAKAQERETTIINFPGNKTAAFFELSTRPGEYYLASLAIYTADPVRAEDTFPDLKRR